ncbi:MAG TPA: TonB-dependent receptor [Spongiibacteraceae bacterium]|nr:TonB-dependent receptor [Spongiibacteraceae bacterium]
MTQHEKQIHRVLQTAAVLPTALLGVGLTVPAHVAHATTADPTEIIVTARRTEEVIQNVPISMTVFNQEMLNERNVTNGADLVAYTPSLNVNSRFGSDQASFAIRGFTQELRTTASVAVYFADVVAPRGSGNITAGDGAGPGSFFDLQNVQVLKGPQGTLFGRNTTGGAIQLVPQEPTSKLEGYLELSTGNYDMKRAQGVLNVPISDSVRARFGVDTMRRDGYVKNMSGIGPDRFSDVDYIAARASMIWDVSDSVQNYTILTYTRSENNGSMQALFACAPAGTSNALGNKFIPMCDRTLAEQKGGFYTTSNGDVEDPVSKLKQWQIINTTSWDVNENFALKNILAYGSLEQLMRGSTFGAHFRLPGTDIPFAYAPSGRLGNLNSNDQATLVEELQASGTAFDEKLQWQAGYYYEDSRPQDWTGQLSASWISCLGVQGDLGSDSSQWACQDWLRANVGLPGSVERQLAKTEYNNQALYSQGTYDITDEFRVTLGLRYTVDHTEVSSRRITYLGFPTQADVWGPPSITKCSIAAGSGSECDYHTTQKSEAPTWLIDFDYLPNPDMMFYAKYARGYRQGSIVSAAPSGFDTFKPEKVDAYEVGAKTTFRGPLPGTFNVSLFYNELTDQQIQWGLIPLSGGVPTTTIVNAGASTIQGVEVETTLKLLDGLMFNLGYTYLDTHLDTLNADALSIPGWASVPSASEGGHLTFSPRHTATTGLSYQLPLPAEVGDINLGATYTFTSSQIATEGTLGTLPARQLLNLNVGWKAIYGSPFDAAFFMTNALNEKYRAYVAGLYDQTGAEFGVQGEPKMWGARVKYNF